MQKVNEIFAFSAFKIVKYMQEIDFPAYTLENMKLFLFSPHLPRAGTHSDLFGK